MVKLINSYKEFKEYLKQLNTKPRLLLHACCGPCSTHTIKLLNEYFDITVFFDNSNIDTIDEFNKRYIELEKVVNEFENVKVNIKVRNKNKSCRFILDIRLIISRQNYKKYDINNIIYCKNVS